MPRAVRNGWLLAWALALAATAAIAAPGRWRIAGDYSHADFGVRLFWLHTVRGRFERIDGAVEPLANGRMAIEARIAVDSLAMDSTRLRRLVLGEAFFDAAEHPTLRFVSAPFPRSLLEAGGALDGRLTLRGVTRPVRFDLLPARCTADACAIQARGRLRRGEFGMTGHRAVLSDQVELALSVALQRTPE